MAAIATSQQGDFMPPLHVIKKRGQIDDESNVISADGWKK